MEESLGLNLYEMPLRQYDPAIARWTGIDPVIHYDFSTYSAFDNNPVYFADPSGADGECYTCIDSGGNGGLANNIGNINSRERNDEANPPKRGQGQNAPYIYEINLSYWPEDFDGPINIIRKFNPDDGYAHFNSLFYHESRIPNRFIAHYLHGGGTQYNLNMAEFKEIAVSRPNIRNSKSFLIAGIGATKGKFIVPSVFANQDGTVGEASFVYQGTLVKHKNGNFTFNGTMQLVDRYDFNWQDKERTLDNKLLTFWGDVSMNGNPYRIEGPKIKIFENQNRHSYFGATTSGRSEINKGKE